LARGNSAARRDRDGGPVARLARASSAFHRRGRRNGPRMKLSYLVRGLPGHPLHPPLTDATIGTYTVATALAVADVTDLSKNAAAHGWWLALVFGLCVTVPTALSGLADWLTISWRTPLWWTATWHLLSMVSATVFFGL